MVRAAHPQGLNLEFALTDGQFSELHSHLFGDHRLRPEDPESGVLALVIPATGRTRRTLILNQIVEPKGGEVFWSPSGGLTMSHGYYSRVISMASQVPAAGIINLHSHPKPTGTTIPPKPSAQDLATDAVELHSVSRALPTGRPTAAGILSLGGGISIREYSFKHPKSVAEAWQPEFGPAGACVTWAQNTRIVGRRIRKLHADPFAPSHEALSSIDFNESSILLWGEHGQRILACLTIGIAGLGGVGGILAEHLARLGVGKLVIVDYDRLEAENFNRSQGAKCADIQAQMPKVDLYSRIARGSATAPKFEMTGFRESVAEHSGLAPLLDCDIIIGAADDAFARQVLDHASYAHLIPIVDGGTTLIPDAKTMVLKAGKSQVAAAGPGFPCLECQGVYTREEATVARESAQWGNYIDGALRDPALNTQLRSPSIISSNALVAGLIGLRILAIALGTTPDAVLGTQRYYIEEGTLCWSPLKACRPGCGKPTWTGLGDSHWIPVGTDLRWQEVKTREGLVPFDPQAAPSTPL